MNADLLDDKNIMTMKLLHYFITEKNYNPIILQGVDNEIWLENLDEDYQVIRIVSNYIHNDEQFNFDVFKTKRIMKKIEKKTLSLSMNSLSIFLDLGENVSNKDNVLSNYNYKGGSIVDALKGINIDSSFSDKKRNQRNCSIGRNSP